MKSINIKLDSTEKVKVFLNKISNCDYTIDLRSGRYVVEAKSILGIFSLDLRKPVVLEIYSDDCNDLINNLKDFIAEWWK